MQRHRLTFPDNPALRKQGRMMNDPELTRGTPWGKDPEPVDLGWWFVGIAALVLGLLPSIIVGLAE